jgi:hypothetical protein
LDGVDVKNAYSSMLSVGSGKGLQTNLKEWALLNRLAERSVPSSCSDPIRKIVMDSVKYKVGTSVPVMMYDAISSGLNHEWIKIMKIMRSDVRKRNGNIQHPVDFSTPELIKENEDWHNVVECVTKSRNSVTAACLGSLFHSITSWSGLGDHGNNPWSVVVPIISNGCIPFFDGVTWAMYDSSASIVVGRIIEPESWRKTPVEMLLRGLHMAEIPVETVAIRASN